jgi:hypothetical protein
MKILFIMDSPEYLRFYDSVIEELAARGHHVSLGVSHGQEKKPIGLEGLQVYADRVAVVGLVPQDAGRWADAARRLRGVMDFVRYLHPRFAVAAALRARMKRKALPAAFHWLDAIPRLPVPVVRAAQRVLTAFDRAVPVSRSIVAFLRDQSPDVLLVSPLVTAASEQVDWIKGARAAGIRSAVCIASWDNLTNKGLLRIEPDRVLVWNEAQLREAHEFHYVAPERVVATGAQLFDRWFVRRTTRGREEFCARAGFADARPFLLFTGSSSFISRSNEEVSFVREWIAALRRAGDPIVRDVNILVRPHPYNFHEWNRKPLADAAGVTVFPPQPYNPVDEDNRADFFDSIYHCAAVVGVNTSAMIEAAIIGRPVCSLLLSQFANTQEGTIHFHHLLPENGGFLRVASTIDEHVRQLSECLRRPEDVRAQTARFVASFIRPHGVSRPATPIFADAVEQLAACAAPRPEPMPVWGYALWPAILFASAIAGAVDWLQDKPLKPKRRQFEKTAHHVRKSVGRVAVTASQRVRRRARLMEKQWQKSVVKPLRAARRS